MKIFLPLFFSILSNISFGQKAVTLETRQDTINYLTSLIRKEDYIGIGMDSDQYWRFIFLLRLMEGPEFMVLAKDSSPCLRVYALMALYHTKHQKKKSVRRFLSNDTATVSILVFDSSYESSVAKVVDKPSNFYWKDYTIEALAILEIEEAREQLFKRAANLEN